MTRLFNDSEVTIIRLEEVMTSLVDIVEEETPNYSECAECGLWAYSADYEWSTNEDSDSSDIFLCEDCNNDLNT